jgi:hypothetical protein
METLAQQFGVTRERVCQLEASAKRKITAALAHEGYGDFAVDMPIRLPATRARRRSVTPAAKRGPLPRVAVAAG